MTTLSLEAVSTVRSSAYRKTAWRLMPFLMLCYLCAYLDRVNVGFAAITANQDLGLTAVQYGWGAGLLFLGYSFFELPSNLALERFGARRWLARIMITWGLLGCGMALVTGPLSFYILRFLLGVAEAGLFPGVILYLTYWLPRSLRARYLGMFALGIPLSSVIGSPISGLIMSATHGLMGLKNWQWLFLLEAIPAVLLGVWVLIALVDRPEKASWLTATARDWLRAEFAREATGAPTHAHGFSWRVLVDPKALTLAAVFFLTGVPSYGLSLWLPQIVKSFGVSHIVTGLLSATPFVFGCIAMVYWGRRSDARQERVWHTMVPAAVAGVALIVGALLTSATMQLLAICVAGAGIYALKGPFLTIVSTTFSDQRAAAGIAVVTTLGNLSGFVAPYMVGLIIEGSGTYRWALAALGIQSFVGAIIIAGWRRFASPPISKSGSIAQVT